VCAISNILADKEGLLKCGESVQVDNANVVPDVVADDWMDGVVSSGFSGQKNPLFKIWDGQYAHLPKVVKIHMDKFKT
jgi:hypothetical protein